MLIIIMTIDKKKYTIENMLRDTLGLYDITPNNIKRVTSDFEERINLYLSVKRLDGLSLKSLHNYNLILVKLAKYLNKSICEVNITVVRTYLTYKCRILLRKYLDSRKDCNEYLFVHGRYIRKQVFASIKVSIGGEYGFLNHITNIPSQLRIDLSTL